MSLRVTNTPKIVEKKPSRKLPIWMTSASERILYEEKIKNMQDVFPHKTYVDLEDETRGCISPQKVDFGRQFVRRPEY